MKAVKKLWNYQYLLISSMYGELDQPFPALTNVGCLTFLVFMVLFIAWAVCVVSAFSGWYGFSMPLTLAVGFSYLAATSSRKLYALAPVSKRYAVANLYLLPLAFSALFYYIFIIFGIISFILGRVILFFTSETPPQDINPITVYTATPTGFKTLLFCALSGLIIILLMTAISVIHRRKARLLSLTSFMMISSALALWLRNTLALRAYNPVESPILPGFNTLPAANAILICMIAALLAIAPLTVRFTYRWHMADVSRKND